MLTYGYGGYHVIGSIHDALPVKTANDPEVWDVQVIVDTAKIGLPGLRWQRLSELTYQMGDRPLVLQHVLQAQQNINDQNVRQQAAILRDILDHYEQFAPETVLMADQLYNSSYVNARLLSQEPALQWKASDRRKSLFEKLSKELPKDNIWQGYIAMTLQSFTQPQGNKASPTPNKP